MLGLPYTHEEIIALPDGEYSHTDYVGVTLRIDGDTLIWYKDGEFIANYSQVGLHKLPQFLEKLKRSSVEIATVAPTKMESSLQALKIPDEQLEFDQFGEKMADIADRLLSQSQTLLRANKGIEAQEIIHKDIEMAVKLLDHAHKNYRRRKKG